MPDPRAVVGAYKHQIGPEWAPLGGVLIPFCTETCARHDGKRCTVLGYRPSHICEPAVAALVTRIEEAPDAR